MAGGSRTLFVLTGADVKPPVPTPVLNPGLYARARHSRRSAQRRRWSFRPCRWAGRISLRPWFDAVWPETVGQASKAVFMSNVGPGTRFDARPRVWPGLLSPVTST